MRLNLLSLALCVSKLPHINIVDFFITRSITSNKFVLSSLNQEIRLLAIFNLVQLSYILTVVFLSVLFWKKYQKHGQSCTAFGASFVQESLCDIFQSVHTSPLAACRNAWGGKNSLRSNIMPPISNHCSAARCASQRCPLDKLLMLAAKSQTSLDFARLHVTFRPWRGITFCNEKARRIVILNTAPPDFAGEPCIL